MKIATLVFLVKDGKALLAEKKRGFGAGFLNGYGGKANLEDQTIEDAARRELREEAAVEAMALEKTAVIEFFEEGKPLFECHVFFCREWAGEPRETEEMAAPQAYELDRLPFDRMWRADKAWLPMVFSGQKIRAKAYYGKGMAVHERLDHQPL